MNVILLSLVLACRFFGLFVVMPLLPLYVLSFENSNPLYVGLAMSIYALSQVIFQVPFGTLSDQWGRKPLIVIGILIFIVGSLLCAYTQNIFLLIVGRFLQGVGAIGGVVSAMVADSVIEEKRTKAMAIMGASISLSFSAAMIIGSSLGAYVGMPALFVLGACLSVLSIVLLMRVPHIPLSFALPILGNVDYSAHDALMRKNLAIMNMTNFLQKMFLTLTFVLIPTSLVQRFDFDITELWKLYVPAAILGVLAMGPASMLAEKKGQFKMVLYIGVVAFMAAYACIFLQDQMAFFVIGILIFFVGFSMHEPIMQSLASKYCKAHQKGRALGIFTSYGYVGSFVGGLLGAHLYLSLEILVACVLLVCVLWCVMLKFLDSPALLQNVYIPFEQLSEDFMQEAVQEIIKIKLRDILHVEGVYECYVNPHEKNVVVRYHASMIEKEEISRRLSL